MRKYLVAIAVLVALPACGALIGIKSLVPDEDDGGSSGIDSGAGGDGAIDANGLDGGDADNCGDVTQSADNCGRCGHSCLGGTCKASACQPTMLATGQGTVSGVALDATNVYFTSLSNNVVARVAKSGGAVATLAKAPDVRFAKRLAVNGTHVYWGNADLPNGTVSRCPLAGCGGVAEVLAQPEEPNGVALDTGYVYWADHNGSKIGRRPLDGGPEELVAIPQGALPYGVAVGGGYAFWIGDFSGEVERNIPADGGTLSIGRNGQSGRDLVLDATFVYWLAAVDPGDPGRVCRAPRDGSGPSQLLGPAGGDPKSLAVDATLVYWTASQTASDGGSSGGVYACALSGCVGAPGVLAGNQDLPSGVAVDATAIYWGANGGVWKLAKP